MIASIPPIAEYATVTTVPIIKQVNTSQPVIVASILASATSWLARKPMPARKVQTITSIPVLLSYLLVMRAGYVISFSLAPRRFTSLVKVMPNRNVPIARIKTYQPPDIPRSYPSVAVPTIDAPPIQEDIHIAASENVPS